MLDARYLAASTKRGRPSAAPPLWSPLWMGLAGVQASSIKHQASSSKHQALRNWALDSGKKFRNLLFRSEERRVGKECLHTFEKTCQTHPPREAAFGRLHKWGAAFGRPPFVEPFVDESGRCSSIKHQASSIKHQASSIKHQESRIKNQVLINQLMI